MAYRRSSGTAPLLFERLRAPATGMPADGTPPPTDARHDAPHDAPHDAGALRASVARELHDLFDTRMARPAGRPDARARTAIDYGLPDLSAFPLGEHAATARLAAQLRAAILAYEPRLREPVVAAITADPARAGGLLVTLTGVLRLGSRAMPVRFELAVGGAAADAA